MLKSESLQLLVITFNYYADEYILFETLYIYIYRERERESSNYTWYNSKKCQTTK